MTEAEIIEMAKRAYLWERINTGGDIDSLIAFARLIQQAQREEDARICEQRLEVFCAAAIRNSGGVEFNPNPTSSGLTPAFDVRTLTITED
jgi:hypothetical protein